MLLFRLFLRSIIFCVFGSISLYAQENFLETYHPYRNKAEMAIVNSDYKTAAKYYTVAFTSVKNPLAKDVFNAMVCHLLLDDFVTAKKYLIKLAGKGILDELLFEMKIFDIYKYKSFFEKNRIIYKSIQELTLKDELASINEKKQILQDFEYKLVKPNLSTGVFDLDYSDLTAINTHIIKEGFVSEKETFLIDNIIFNEQKDLTDDGEINVLKELNLVKNATGRLLNRISFFGRPFSKEDSITKLRIDSMLILSVKNGTLNPQYAIQKSFLYEQKSDFNETEVIRLSVLNDSTCSYLLNNQYVRKTPLTKQQLANHEELKTIFGLESIEDKHEKDKFAFFKNKYFIFPNIVKSELLSVSNCEEAEHEIVGFQIVKNEK